MKSVAIFSIIAFVNASSQGNNVPACANTVLTTGNSATAECNTTGPNAGACKAGVDAAMVEANQPCHQYGKSLNKRNFVLPMTNLNKFIEMLYREPDVGIHSSGTKMYA
jgi:hypothetical protein